jgi:N-acetylglucosaminyldiphosphoundecaprenol N-acetyl-beta-D-mannosaminyltransferase
MVASPSPNPVAPLADIPRANVLGVGISAITMEDAADLFRHAIENGVRGYVCVTGVHGVMEARKNPALRRILNSSLLSTPDGMPMVWVARMQGFTRIRRVFGPDLMRRICEISAREGQTHFLYGGKAGAVGELKEALHRQYPGVRVVGAYTPPFRPLDASEERELTELVARLKPDIFWVGLSTPKQEQFMARYSPILETRLMVGVGAAFDYLTGSIRDAPDWVKTAGLQWLHRLVQEPRRLWKRYLVNNPRFIWEIALQLTRMRTYPIEKV